MTLRLGLLSALLAACATPGLRAPPSDERGFEPPPPLLSLPLAAPAGPRTRIVRRADSYVGLASLAGVSRGVPDDCTGLARLAYAGADLLGHEARLGDDGVTAMYRHARALGALHRTPPRPGDLVFFRDTTSRGAPDDGALTHVGVVVSVDENGTIAFVHRTNEGVRKARMTLREPHRHAGPNGAVLNDYLRRRSAERGARLTGELFAGFASADRLAPNKPAAVATRGE